VPIFNWLNITPHKTKMGNTNLKKLRSALENPDQEKEIKKLFNHYDKNKNGKIDLFVKIFLFF
jgi:Ca2+-binding EF-hand superfamily protein